MVAAKRLYTPREYFSFIDDIFAHFGDMKLMRDKTLVDDAFSERLMLAVTEVNGCRYCSYFHSGQALKAGMSEEEIAAMLGGDKAQVPEEEGVAILFAQHYAESGGSPDAEAVARLYEVYGDDKARAIMSPIRMIMLGNVSGNNFDGLVHRLKGKAFEGSSVWNELGVVLGTVLAIPWSGIKKLIGII